MPSSRHRQYTKGSHTLRVDILTLTSVLVGTKPECMHYDCAQYFILLTSRTLVECYIVYARVSGNAGSHVLQYGTVRYTISFNYLVGCAQQPWMDIGNAGQQTGP
jgi:hypothetical protein